MADLSASIRDARAPDASVALHDLASHNVSGLRQPPAAQDRAHRAWI
jgi:hypothetical protein